LLFVILSQCYSLVWAGRTGGRLPCRRAVEFPGVPCNAVAIRHDGESAPGKSRVWHGPCGCPQLNSLAFSLSVVESELWMFSKLSKAGPHADLCQRVYRLPERSGKARAVSVASARPISRRSFALPLRWRLQDSSSTLASTSMIRRMRFLPPDMLKLC
jgi:hypothetical protein